MKILLHLLLHLQLLAAVYFLSDLPQETLGFVGVPIVPSLPPPNCAAILARRCSSWGLAVSLAPSPEQKLGQDVEDRRRLEHELFQSLYAALDQQQRQGKKKVLLRLDSKEENDDSEGTRGVYVNHHVKKGEALLSIHLSDCIRDDRPPDWFPVAADSASEEEDDNDVFCSDCAMRNAAALLDLELRAALYNNLNEVQQMWLSLLPNPSYLRASLPVHWPESVLYKAKSSELELAVDRSYFSRAHAVQDLLECLMQQHADATSFVKPKKLRQMVDNALDLVQTRSCRVVPTSGRPIRLLAPVCDFINHGDSSSVNAEFILEHDDESQKDESSSMSLVVRALKDISPGSEVFISYGDSARPDWKCLCSYGFVPKFQSGMTLEVDEHTAEVFFEGRRFLVSPDSVSEDLVYAMAFAMGKADESRVVLTPDIALRLAQRIAEAAFQVLLLENDHGLEQNDYKAGHNMEIPETVISERLAASLRWNQHRILMACSLGLRDWAVKHS